MHGPNWVLRLEGGINARLSELVKWFLLNFPIEFLVVFFRWLAPCITASVY